MLCAASFLETGVLMVVLPAGPLSEPEAATDGCGPRPLPATPGPSEKARRPRPAARRLRPAAGPPGSRALGVLQFHWGKCIPVRAWFRNHFLDTV